MTKKTTTSEEKYDYVSPSQWLQAVALRLETSPWGWIQGRTADFPDECYEAEGPLRHQLHDNNPLGLDCDTMGHAATMGYLYEVPPEPAVVRFQKKHGMSITTANDFPGMTRERMVEMLREAI